MALRDFEAQLGREDSLYVVHNAVVRAAQAIRPVVESGAVLAACSDEFNGEVRSAFASDVARMLIGPHVPGHRRVFSVSNLGGRIEPGAIALANLHFTAQTERAGEKLLLVEIAGHVGRRETPGGSRWGELDRFGTVSPCCGALQLLLDKPAGAESVRFPWFDQLTAFFGPERLAALRQDATPFRMLRAAVVHAVLQSESALVDLLREPPATGTHVLLVALVVVNRRGTDHALPVAIHHLSFLGGVGELRFGASLRSTPAALVVDASQSNLKVSSPFAPEQRPPTRPAPAVGSTGSSPTGSGAAPEVAKGIAGLHPPPPPVPGVPRVFPQALNAEQRSKARGPEVQAHLVESRRRLQGLMGHPSALNVYARPLLRAFVQGLSILAPEVALAAFPLELAGEWLHAHRVKALLARGPSTEEARKLLHELEPTLQQLGHKQAREVLETLLAGQHPLLGASG